MMKPDRKRAVFFVLIASLSSLAIPGWIVHERRNYRLTMADYHLGEMAALDQQIRSDGHFADTIEGKVPDDEIRIFLDPSTDSKVLRENVKQSSRKADYHASLSRKYREAAASPWISFETDLPNP